MKRKVHFSDGRGPICGSVTDRAIGPRSPQFPVGVSCSKCLKRIAEIAGALMQFKKQVETAVQGNSND